MERSYRGKRGKQKESERERGEGKTRERVWKRSLRERRKGIDIPAEAGACEAFL